MIKEKIKINYESFEISLLQDDIDNLINFIVVTVETGIENNIVKADFKGERDHGND